MIWRAYLLRDNINQLYWCQILKHERNSLVLKHERKQNSFSSFHSIQSSIHRPELHVLCKFWYIPETPVYFSSLVNIKIPAFFWNYKGVKKKLNHFINQHWKKIHLYNWDCRSIELYNQPFIKFRRLSLYSLLILTHTPFKFYLRFIFMLTGLPTKDATSATT